MPRTLRPQTWNKQFANAVRKGLGPNYPMPRQDWNDGEYLRNCERLSPKEAAEKVISQRNAMVPTRQHCKAWHDSHDENGIHREGLKGQFRCEPCVPPSVLITIQAAIENGCTHGTVKHWENAFPQFRHVQDVRPVLFCWETL